LAQKHPIIGDVRGLGLLWAVLLMADRSTRREFDPKLGLGNWIQDWCYENGMILRNNGNILVLAPSLIISREEVDMVIDTIDRALDAAERHFGL
jgi:putrescine aminotransferase